MSKMIQVRNVPEELHRKLKARAATGGMSLSDYLLQELREIAERPTWAELRERMKQLEPLTVPLDTEAAVRAERDSR
jgi:plasmid stability protein